jgi:hypothetical protein
LSSKDAPLALSVGTRNHGDMPVPRCAALRRDGLPCGALALSPEAEFCRHHEQLIEQHGEQAIREGRYPKSRKARDTDPVVVESTAITTNGLAQPGAGAPRARSGRS